MPQPPTTSTTSRSLANISAVSGPAQKVTAWSDAWVVTEEEWNTSYETECYLVSLVGSPLAVRALQSAFVGATGLKIRAAREKTLTVRPVWSTNYRTRWSRLPSGALHALIVADHPPDGRRIVFATSEETLPDTLFAELITSRGLMALPQWRH